MTMDALSVSNEYSSMVAVDALDAVSPLNINMREVELSKEQPNSLRPILRVPSIIVHTFSNTLYCNTQHVLHWYVVEKVGYY